MKNINNYVVEKLQLGKKLAKTHQYEIIARSKKELVHYIEDITKQHIDNEIIDLNMIDTSLITNMEYLFEENPNNYDISQWDVSNVEYMQGMFMYSNFDNDISQWDVSNVSDMSYMFSNSKFNHDISQWDVSNVHNMEAMFRKCPLEKNPPKWYKQ